MGPLGGAEIVHREYFFPTDQYPLSPSFGHNLPNFLWEVTPPKFPSRLVPTKLTPISLQELGTLPMPRPSDPSNSPHPTKMIGSPRKARVSQTPNLLQLLGKVGGALSTGVANLVVGKPRNAAAQHKGRQDGEKRDY